MANRNKVLRPECQPPPERDTSRDQRVQLTGSVVVFALFILPAIATAAIVALRFAGLAQWP